MLSRKFKDGFAHRLMLMSCGFVIVLAVFLVAGLYLKAKPIFSIISLKDLFLSAAWHPTENKFGIMGFILGTLWVTGIAMAIAVPLSILTAIFISEYAPARVRGLVKPVIDLLAGISPVIYGVWGIIAIVPLVGNHLMPFLSERLRFFPFLSDNYTGYCALTGGIVLAVMVFPIIISIVEEVLGTVSFEVREVSMALGATKWQTIKYAVLRKALPGIVAAVILGLSRAFGETIAVLMVAGCALGKVPGSVFDTAYPLPALIANTYGEMMSIPLYDSAVMLAALVLLLITTFFNVVSWNVLLHIERTQA